MTEQAQPQTALILGSRGLIGATLAGRLAADHWRVIGLDNDRAMRGAPGWRAPFLAFRRSCGAPATQLIGDVADTKGLEQILHRHRPSAVVYLSALLASESRAFPDEAEEIQVHALDRLMGLCSLVVPTIRFLLASSSYVYGNFAGEVATEERPLRPIDVYGTCKARAEDLVRASDLDWSIIRPAAVYGIGDPRARYVSSSIERAAVFGKIIVDHPDFSADFTYVDDVVEVMRSALTRAEATRRIFNVTREDPRTNSDLVNILRRRLPYLEVKFEGGELPSDVPRRGVIDCTAARTTLGWQAAVSFDDGALRELELAVTVKEGGDEYL